MENAATSLQHTLETAGATAFNCTTRSTPRRPGKPWWTDECTQAVQARRRAWSRWRRTPTLEAGKEYRRFDAACSKTILKAYRNAWGSHCSSLSFSSSTKRTWDFLHAMEGKKARHPLPLTDGTQAPLDDLQKAELLARHYHQKLSLPSTLHPPPDFHLVLSTSTASPGPQQLAQPFTQKELKEALTTLNTGKAPGHDNIPYEFLTHLTPRYWMDSYIYITPAGCRGPTQPVGNRRYLSPSTNQARIHHYHQLTDPSPSSPASGS